jgi:hypothetical protein
MGHLFGKTEKLPNEGGDKKVNITGRKGREKDTVWTLN